MLRPELDWSLCQICQPCDAQSVCKVRAIVKLDPDEAPYLDLRRCNGCGDCVSACVPQAIVMKKMGR